MTPESTTEPGIDLVLVRVLGRGAVGGLEDGVPGQVVDVAAGGDADAAHLRRQRVAEVVAVQVGGGDHVEFLGAGQHLLQGDVGDGVLDHDAGAGLALGDSAPGPAVDFHRAEELLGHLEAPVPEGAFRELHDIALVDQGQALALVQMA